MGVWEFAAAVVLALLAGGGVAVAIINGRNERKMHKIKRQEEQEDKAKEEASKKTAERLAAMEKQMNEQSAMLEATKEALKYVLYDRIRHIAEGYIAAGEVDFDDRRILNGMHHSYHFGLDGNGDLDNLMGGVNHLPLKAR